MHDIVIVTLYTIRRLWAEGKKRPRGKTENGKKQKKKTHQFSNPVTAAFRATVARLHGRMPPQPLCRAAARRGSVRPVATRPSRKRRPRAKDLGLGRAARRHDLRFAVASRAFAPVPRIGPTGRSRMIYVHIARTSRVPLRVVRPVTR